MGTHAHRTIFHIKPARNPLLIVLADTQRKRARTQIHCLSCVALLTPPEHANRRRRRRRRRRALGERVRISRVYKRKTQRESESAREMRGATDDWRGQPARNGWGRWGGGRVYISGLDLCDPNRTTSSSLRKQATNAGADSNSAADDDVERRIACCFLLLSLDSTVR